MTDQRYYTPREVARRLRVSPTTVMKLIHDERLYAVRVSERVYRIPVPALRRFEQGATGPQVTVRVREVDALESLGEPVADLAASSRR